MASEKIAQFTAFNLWVGVAASATAWGLAVWPFGSFVPSDVPVASESAVLSTPSAQNIAKVLGGGWVEDKGADTPAGVPMASRLVLSGVAKAGSAQSVALIAVDGQPAKTFQQGQEVLPGWVLQSVSANQAMLGVAIKQPTLMTLSLPQPSAAAKLTTQMSTPAAPSQLSTSTLPR